MKTLPVFLNVDSRFLTSSAVVASSWNVMMMTVVQINQQQLHHAANVLNEWLTTVLCCTWHITGHFGYESYWYWQINWTQTREKKTLKTQSKQTIQTGIGRPRETKGNFNCICLSSSWRRRWALQHRKTIPYYYCNNFLICLLPTKFHNFWHIHYRKFATGAYIVNPS